MLRIILLLVLCLIAAPALAADPPPTPAAAQPTPTLAGRRDALKDQLQKLMQQQVQISQAIEQTRGAIAVLSEYAPEPPAPPPPK